MKTREQIDQAINTLMLEAACYRQANADDPDDFTAETLEAWAGVLTWAIDDGSQCVSIFSRELSRLMARHDQILAAYREANP
jgi:hypothetical protein